MTIREARVCRPIQLTDVDRRRLLALSLPLAVPVAMRATFGAAQDRLGDHLGYLAGFGAYWLTCTALTVGLIGPQRARALFRDRRSRLGRPALLSAALLVWPPAGAIATRFLPERSVATPARLATIGAVALVNAVLEEALWRGVYITLWPDKPFLGCVWPAIGFGAWHLAPQVIHPSTSGSPAYVSAATLLGLSWGWVAYRTGTLRWVAASHVLTDGAGLQNARYFLGG
jgi:membrane protease YdiL (CAAX protease family)